MCRFIAYIGTPIFMSGLMSGSENSLICQAMAAREAKTEVNADGCGLGWYAERRDPGCYRSVLPAWSDPNLLPLADQIKSGLFMAHVRSATTGEVAYANCHPFIRDRHMFMHNGMITDYRKIRASVERMIADNVYENVKGSTDSEAIFHAALSKGLDDDPVLAMHKVLAEITVLQNQKLGQGRVRFAAIHSDGDRIWAYRWASDNRPPSLYYHPTPEGTIIASEPFENDKVNWTPVPANSAICFGKDGSQVGVSLDAARAA